MKVTIHPSEIDGSVVAPPSKSITHRAVMCALQAEGTSLIENPLYCDDTLSSIDACRQLGANIRKDGTSLEITGSGRLFSPSKEIWCGGSASTMRMLMGISARVQGKVTLTGDDTLLRRPIAPLARSLDELGAVCSMPRKMGYPPVTIDGSGFVGGSTTIPGNESSQYLSSLLLSAPCTRLGAHIVVDPVLESVPYVNMTVSTLEEFNITITHDDAYSTVDVPGEQTFKPHDMRIEGDYSSAAFLLAAGALAGKVTVSGIKKGSAQGDGEIVDILKKFGADVLQAHNMVTVNKSNLSAIELDCKDIPDLVPIIASLATQAEGKTVLRGISRLRIKESDRVASISAELKKIGGDISSSMDMLIINGPTKIHGANIQSHSDHRIAMSCAVMALVSCAPVTIEGADCISKSYPGFFNDMRSIGGEVDDT